MHREKRTVATEARACCAPARCGRLVRITRGSVRQGVLVLTLIGQLLPVAASEAGSSTQPAVRELSKLDDAVRGDLDRLLKAPPSPFSDDIYDAASAATITFLGSLAASDDPLALVRGYAGAFGNGDWRQDLRFVLMAPHIAVPSTALPWRMVVGEGDRLRQRSATIRLIANEVARIQVQRASHDPKYLERLYVLTLCYGSFGTGEAQRASVEHFLIRVNQGAKAHDRDEIWWHIRNFVVLCHALNLDAIANGVTPENFRQKVDRLTDLYATFYSPGMIPAPDGKTWLPALARGQCDASCDT